MAINTESLKDGRDNLSGGLKSVMQDAQDLVDATGEEADDRFKAAREKLKAALQTAKSELPKVTKKAVEKSKHAAHVTDEYVGGNPWTAVGVAAAIGLLAGVIIGRSK
ncbi:DUF883 family protein [Glaciimonas immobilis]|uniref:ElaB/YqjD/DUF883 family membrane-anchored ribosome-binding protein n=1 Tax=Glaciimonas immobilis TaxID=728004 RepID=A0A840RTG9_9BURK|nr:DUF883 family protein [Glaciimonas immobilis]KAF3997395.1 DUF883 family protein [Glaciimonas immobilis]MBB5200943.1 ElaB/YqjD/DUF883 family membrane-anchored ribosome-binding protein [Glaciimonas immobilis]